LRKELEDNQFYIPFRQGACQNRKTGYVLASDYNPDTTKLVIAVTYPVNGKFPMREVCCFLNRIMDSTGEISRT
jgi:hypothetical protein